VRTPVAAALLLLLAIGVAGSSGCAAANRAGLPTAHSAALGVPVAVRSHRFDPRSVTIKAAQTVTWTNYDNTPHVVGGTGFNSELAPGTTYSHRFDSAGTYEYIDTLHPDMVGIVVVR
jgi:plastocyanin